MAGAPRGGGAAAKGGKSSEGRAAILSAAPQGKAAAGSAPGRAAMGESPLLPPLSGLRTAVRIAVTRSGSPRSGWSTPRVGSPSGQEVLAGRRGAPHAGPGHLPRVSPPPKGVTASLPRLGHRQGRFCGSLARDPPQGCGGDRHRSRQHHHRPLGISLCPPAKELCEGPNPSPRREFWGVKIQKLGVAWCRLRPQHFTPRVSKTFSF